MFITYLYIYVYTCSIEKKYMYDFWCNHIFYTGLNPRRHFIMLHQTWHSKPLCFQLAQGLPNLEREHHDTFLIGTRQRWSWPWVLTYETYETYEIVVPIHSINHMYMYIYMCVVTYIYIYTNNTIIYHTYIILDESQYFTNLECWDMMG